MQQRQHQGRREREQFSLLASTSSLCSLRGPYGSPCILLHLFSIAKALSLCNGNGPFVLAYRAMPSACMHARASLLLNNLLCFLFLGLSFLSFVLFLFLLPSHFFLLFTWQLPSLSTLATAATATARFCYWPFIQ